MAEAESSPKRPPANPEPKRIKGFATYFKEYMGISSLVTAALPIPVTAAKLIPMYSAQMRFFSVYTSLFCFLLLGFVFFVRDRLAGIFFRRRPNGSFGSRRFAIVPPVLILVCAMMIVSYHFALNVSMGRVSGNANSSMILANTDEREIPLGLLLMLLYLGIFLSAEGAFILMATKEYLQDMLGIPDTDLFAAQMIPDRGCIVRVESDTNAKDARVLVDGEVFSNIPCGVELRPGEHLIVVQKDGFETWSKRVRIAPTDLTLLIDVHMDDLLKKW